VVKLYGPEDPPRAFIQWKGTDVCMDVTCICGENGHVDADFAYVLKCGKCGQLYAMPAHVALYPIQSEEAAKMCEPITFKDDEAVA